MPHKFTCHKVYHSTGRVPIPTGLYCITIGRFVDIWQQKQLQILKFTFSYLIDFISCYFLVLFDFSSFIYFFIFFTLVTFGLHGLITSPCHGLSCTFHLCFIV